MKKICLILTLVLHPFINAQNTGTVKGILTDKEVNNESLPFANILIKGTSIGTTSDIDGTYTLQAPTGNQVIVFSFVGYQTIEQPIIVVSGQSITVNQVMSANQGVTLDEIEIKATINKETARALLLEQKKAAVIKESIGAQELAEKGVSNAAGAVAKISGVSKQEGSSNVYVRGLGDRYLNTTMNGLTLPSNNVDKKNINLNLFPSDIIQNISISKAYSSEFYGDFAAGNINITSKEYKGKSFIDINLGTGINTTASTKNFRKSEGTGFFGYYNRYQHNPFAVVLSHGVDPVDGGTPINATIGVNAGTSFKFKDNSRLSLFGTASFQRDFQYREGPSVDFINVFKKGFNAKEYEYSTLTTIMGNAIYGINDKHQLKYTSLFLNNSTDQVGYYGFDGSGKNRDAILNTDEGFYQMNVQFNQDLIFVNQLTGEHKFWESTKEDKEKIKLTWGIGYNNVFAHEPDRRRISLENYQFALDTDPNTHPSFYNNNVFDNQRYFEKIIDKELNGRINITYNPSKKITLNFGYNARIKERAFENIRYGYDFLAPNVKVTDVNNIDSILKLENLGVIYTTEVFNSLPNFNSTNFPGLNENIYNGKLKIHAGYMSMVYNPSEKWSIIPGIRIENINQRIDYDVININPNDPGFREADESFILPSLNIKYALKENQNLRFSFGRTISIPEFKEVAPFVYEGVSQRIGGNPDLLNSPSFANIFNFDLKYEWFISRSELVSISSFYKQISNPINLVIANDATGTLRYFRASDKAKIFGVEIEIRKDLIKNRDDETQLSSSLNIAYMSTDQDLKDVTGLYTATFNRTNDDLQGASPYIVNASVSYSPTNFNNYKPIATLVHSYFYDRIDVLGSGTGNIVENGVSTIDLVLKNKIGKNWEVNMSIKNLLNPTISYVRENTSTKDVFVSSPNGKGIAKYNQGINFGVQLKYKF